MVNIKFLFIHYNDVRHRFFLYFCKLFDENISKI